MPDEPEPEVFEDSSEEQPEPTMPELELDEQYYDEYQYYEDEDKNDYDIDEEWEGDSDDMMWTVGPITVIYDSSSQKLVASVGATALALALIQ